jgi:hypothetical protein
MKKIILAVTILALAGSQVQTAKAGVVGGLALGTAIGVAVSQPPVYYAPAPAYSCPPVAYSAPTVVYPRPLVVARPVPVVYVPPVYVTAPVVAFGFGRPYYRGYYGRFCGSPRYYSRGRWY